MKRIITIIAVAISTMTMAQAPDLMSYQAVVWDTGNNLVVSSNVGLQFSILQGSVTGTAVYVEIHTATTNANGLVTTEIGNGTVVSGDIALIDWSAGPYFLKTETDPTGGTSYTISGTTQLLSVPYALHAGTVENDLDEQTLSISGSDLTISNGNTVTLPTGGAGDDWGAQVVQTDATLSGDGTTGNELTVVGDLTDDQDLTFTSPNLSISGGNTVDLSTLQDGVNDADADPSNEIQTISISGNTITLSTGGGSVTVPSGADNWGTQVVETDATLSGDGTTGNALTVVGDLSDDQNLSDVLGQGNDAGGTNIVNTGAVGIGTATPNSSAALEVNSTTQGFLPPVMTDAERDAIASPAAGLMIYNSTTGCMNYYNGTGWYSMCGDVIPTPGSGLSAATANTHCLQILLDHPSSTDGVYWIDPDGSGAGNPPFECYCDMTTDGGGWTLVMSNNQGLTNPTPDFSTAINGVTVTGTMSSSLTSFDIIVGVSNWAAIGTTAMYQVGTSPTSITNAAKYDISLNAGSNYALSLSNESILAGGTSSGWFTVHNGFQLSAYDQDNDIFAGNCSVNYGNSVWWFMNCWNGSIWGHNASDGAFWTGATIGAGSAWGGIWIR